MIALRENVFFTLFSHNSLTKEVSAKVIFGGCKPLSEQIKAGLKQF